MARLVRWAERGAEALGALFFALMFASFLLQVFSRYVLDSPLGWTLEACLVTYLWSVFWAAAWLLRMRDHVRFDLLVRMLPARGRRLAEAAGNALTLAVFALAFWPTLDWVRFMAIDRTWVLGIRFDLLFSVYVLFMAAVMVRALLGLLAAVRGWGERGA